MTTSAPGLSVEQWIEKLNGQWQELVDKSVRGFVELGHNLIEAKGGLQHGEWERTLNGLCFHPAVARKFIRIARWVDKKNGRIASDITEVLPPDYTTIDQLTSLDDETLRRFVANGTVSPKLRRNEIKTIINLEKVEADRERVKTLQPRRGKFKTIIVDPAWEYEGYSESVNAKAGYARQSMEELRALDMKQWAEENCHLWCWTTDGYIRKALDLVDHWGFQYRQMLVWAKPNIGRGQYMRTATEHALFCTLGNLPAKTLDIPTWFSATIGRHSEKPDEFYAIVERMCWEPYGEANQRKFRPKFQDLFMVGEPLQAAV